MAASDYRVEMIRISKSFGGVHALREVSLQVRAGEVHVLVGENGAGKSTLMKILSGAIRRDSGEILIDGQPAHIADPRDAKSRGIGIIYQELALAPDLTVGENICISQLGGRFGIVSRRVINATAARHLGELGLDIDPQVSCGSLSIAYQQIVEIAKVLSENVRILILDEPTAVLAPPEVERLFEVLRRLRRQGVSIIYISHRLNEIFKIADRVTVIRDGAVTGTVDPAKGTLDDIIALMIGRKLENLYPRRETRIGGTVFSVEHLTCGHLVRDITFSLSAGEVLGIAGLVGSGRTETIRAIFGADRRESGTVSVGGKVVRIRSPKDAVKNGLALVPEDRKGQGVLLSLSIRENLAMTRFGELSNAAGWMKLGKERTVAKSLVERLEIKTRTPEAAVSSLSGGNQQKVVLAKWFDTDCSVAFFDEPTRGVDIGSKVEIYRLINSLAEQGLGIVVVSSEMIELIGMCDRVIVMHEGAIQGELHKADLTEENIMRLAVGSSGNGNGGFPNRAEASEENG